MLHARPTVRGWYRRVPLVRAPCAVAVASCLLVAPAPALGLVQSEGGPAVGETVRVNGDFVGRVVAVEDTSLTVFGQGPPSCTAGIYHGDSAICTPAPMEQQIVDMRTVMVERAATGAGRTKQLIVGVLLGGVAGTGAGYAIGPVLGFGKLSTCVGSGRFRTCGRQYTPPEIQRASDQRRGALFLGFVGATVGGLLANALMDDWVTIEPSVAPPEPGSGFRDPVLSLRMYVPLGGR